MAGFSDFPRDFSMEGSQSSRNPNIRPHVGFRIEELEPIDEMGYAANLPKQDNEDQMQKATGFCIGAVNFITDHLLGHPCIVARRQCQVNRGSLKYHITPFTLIPVMVKLQSRQYFNTLWKGIGSVFIVQGLQVATETVISEVSILPKEVDSNSTPKQLILNVALKSITFACLSPFYCVSVIETVQSDIASEKPGIFDCLKEGVCRVFGVGTPQSARLLPVWVLVTPTLLNGVLHYVVASGTQLLVTWFINLKLQRNHRLLQEREKLGPLVPGNNGTEQVNTEMTALFMGKLVADVLLYPLETVTHRLYLQGTRTIIDNLDSGVSVTPVISYYTGMFDCFHSISREEGTSGFYKGFGALILQYALHALILKVSRFILDEWSYMTRKQKWTEPKSH